MKKETLAKHNRNQSSRTLLKDETPVYRIINQDRQSISNVELLSAIISTGHDAINLEIARNLLQYCNQSLAQLGKLSIYEIQAVTSLPLTKCAQIHAAIELGRRRELDEILPLNQIRSSKDAYDIMYPSLSDLDHEEFWVLYLNKANRVFKTERHSIGGIAGTVVDVKLLLRNAITFSASAIILAHNHPSGNMQPSDADRSITKKLLEASKLMEIALLDHIIIGNREYYSFADNGMI
jgi:DNA repair protein RadC